MYVPTHFAVPDEQAAQWLAAGGFAHLVTAAPDGLRATPLPMLYDADRHALVGHLARNNPHWQGVDGAESIAILAGVDGYVSPSWYASKAEHGRVVPTWNYDVLHVHGVLHIHDDVEWLRRLVGTLTDRHEAGRDAPWSVTDAPAKYVDGQLRAIVGVELSVVRVEAKAKLSQNRPAADRAGVVAGLTAAGDAGLAERVARA